MEDMFYSYQLISQYKIKNTGGLFYEFKIEEVKHKNNDEEQEDMHQEFLRTTSKILEKYTEQNLVLILQQ